MEQVFKSFDQMLREQVSPEWTQDRTMSELQKAFTTGNPGVPGSTTSDALNMRLLNLDSTMSSVLFQARHLKLFNWINRVPSVNALYEWNRRERYGSSRGMFGFPEGGAPAGSAAAYTRHNTYVRYMGVRGGVTHQLSVAGQMGGYQLDPVEEEHHNRTMELLEKIERHIFFGDSTILDGNGNTVLYDGLLNQLATSSVGATHVIDKQGAPMRFEDFEESAYTLIQEGFVPDVNNFGVFMSPFVLSDLSKSYLSLQRKLIGANPGENVPGMRMAGYDTNYGRFGFDYSVMLEPVRNGAFVTTAEPGSPAAPTTVTTVAATDAASNLAYSTTYYYRVAAFNAKGESLSTAAVGVATAASPTRNHITVSWAAPAPTGDPLTTALGVHLYRGLRADGTDAKWVARLPIATTSYVDVNQQIPGSGYVAIMSRAPEDLVIAQMTPLLRFPLAVVNTTIEFLLLLYHTLVMKVPERQIIYRNVGRYQVA